MNFNSVIVCALLSVFCLSFALAQDLPKVDLPLKENFHLFLLAGQSNMAGRGIVGGEDRQVHPRVLALSKDGVWKPAVDPIHFDKPIAGVGPGRSFGIVLADGQTNITVGLIPAACGGSAIADWDPGVYYVPTTSHPYDDAIKRAKAAMQVGTLKAILWHQGETDCTNTLAPAYRERLSMLIARFRKDLDAPNLPVIIGQLAQFDKAPWNDATRAVNAAQIAVAHEVPHVAFVESTGLTPLNTMAEDPHFGAAAAREFGKRYAAAYLRLGQMP